jgi:hypothetical protein
MKKLLLLSFILVLTSCEKYVTEIRDLSLSGKYVVSKLEVTNVDQNQTRDSLYLLGTTYNNSLLPKPFDNIRINNFYVHMDYSTIRMKILGVTPSGQDIWKYGSGTDPIFYNTFGATPFSFGYMQFSYITDDGSSRTITFLIEDDGFETLQLKSSGAWFNGKFGQKQVMTLSLSRVGP